MGDPILIVGAGQSAAQAVTTLREEGFDGPIALFGDESILPYQRPPLSKAYLAREITAERLELRPRSFYLDRNVELHLDCRVIAIDPAAQTVTTHDSRQHRYSRLLLATGTRSRPLAIPGDHRAGVHHIRALSDVARIRHAFVPGARLVVIGGGYIGLEVAAKARTIGLDVVVIEAADRVLARVVASETAAHMAELHAKHGVALRCGERVIDIGGSDCVATVTLTSGTVLPADVILVAVGAIPNTELAMTAGIECTNGIPVDASSRTSAPEIYASGDVACFPSARYGRAVRLESVQNAIEQSKVAARSMLGIPAIYDPVPWFWSDQYDAKLQIAGLSAHFDRVERESDAMTGRFSLKYFKQDRLIAVDTINDPRSHMLARRSLAEGCVRRAA